MRIDEGRETFLAKVPKRIKCYEHGDGIWLYDPANELSVRLGTKWTAFELKGVLHNLSEATKRKTMGDKAYEADLRARIGHPA